jgi:WD40 repeat protein
MNPKFIEISSGKNSPRTMFEIIEVEKDKFMLKTKDSHVGLYRTLQNWLQSNILLEESSYSVMLWERSSSVIKEALNNDNLLIGGNEELVHWSVSQEKVTVNYGAIMGGVILSMAQTSDKNHLFLSDT